MARKGKFLPAPFLIPIKTPTTPAARAAVCEGGLAVKILAADGVELRRALLAVREILIPATQVEFPPALKRAQTFFF